MESGSPLQTCVPSHTGVLEQFRLLSDVFPCLECDSCQGMVFVLRNPRGATATGCYIDSGVVMEEGAVVTPKVTRLPL
jgi:hypothetical protein